MREIFNPLTLNLIQNCLLRFLCTINNKIINKGCFLNSHFSDHNLFEPSFGII